MHASRMGNFGWHRHVSLVMLAFAMTAVIRHPSSVIGPMLGYCLKKRGRGLDRSIVLDPLVDPGNPPHRHQACPAADPARPYPRMVVLAQGPSGQRARGSSHAKSASVMLGDPSSPLLSLLTSERPPFAHHRAEATIDHGQKDRRGVQIKCPCEQSDGMIFRNLPTQAAQMVNTVSG
jgi:hypothetical protein